MVTLPLAEEDFIESLHLKEVFIEFDNEEVYEAEEEFTKNGYLVIVPVI